MPSPSAVLPATGLLLLCGLATPAQADTFAVDKSHSGVSFRVTHLGLSYTWGTFGDLDGSFVIDPDPGKMHFNFTVRATSVDTQNEKRDKHLRNDDFFDVETHPDIQFVSTEVTPAENGWKVSGEMTMLNKTLPLVVEIKKIGEGKDPWGGYRAGIQSEFSIQRSDFGMDYNLTGIGDEVQVFVDIEGKRKSKN